MLTPREELQGILYFIIWLLALGRWPEIVGYGTMICLYLFFAACWWIERSERR